MPFSIMKKFYEDINKQMKTTEICGKEFKEYKKCINENKECTDILNIWLKCKKTALERKNINI